MYVENCFQYLNIRSSLLKIKQNELEIQQLMFGLLVSQEVGPDRFPILSFYQSTRLPRIPHLQKETRTFHDRKMLTVNNEKQMHQLSPHVVNKATYMHMYLYIQRWLSEIFKVEFKI